MSNSDFYKPFPKLTGEPRIGEWYQITPKCVRSSDGSEWHGIFRKGSVNKVVIFFFGGGVSITGETSERAGEFFTTAAAGQDFVAKGGIGCADENNPFKDWTYIALPYASGDFHTGTGEYHYLKNGKDVTVYHNGYNNYSACMDEIKRYTSDTDTLLITGFSAGGFAAALLADDVIGRFPTAENITVCVDSALLLYDGWHDTAVNLWRTPKEISDRLVSNNIVLDSLTALYKKRGNSVKILFDCSYRDDALLQHQSYVDNGKMMNTKALGDKFQKDLKDMVTDLQTNVPGIGIYIWELNQDPETKNTQHTIVSGDIFNKLGNEKNICEWIYDAVNGDIQTFGIELLDKPV